MKKTTKAAGLAAAVAIGGALLSFSPETDMARTLGGEESRWAGMYAPWVDDGEGNRVTIAELAERNHSALTPESRAAANAHPIGAITGLSAALQPATQVTPGLMSPDDKTRLDNAETILASAVVAEASVRADADEVLARRIDAEAAARSSSDAAHAADQENPHAVTAEQVGLGSVDNTSDLDKPISTAVQTALELKADTRRFAEEMAYKADLVGGVVPDAQLPSTVKVHNWPVATKDDLITLTEATVNDRAFVGDADPDTPPAEGDGTYYLLALPPTDSANWRRSGDGAGAAEVDPVYSAEKQYIYAALDDKANASDLPPVATASVAGKAKPGSGMTVDSAGALHVAYGTTAATAAAGNDSRLSNARTPTAHAATHRTGGADALTAADVGALSSTGTAAAATKLVTARTIQTNLGSTAAASFNGTANVAPGVAGTLPIANGGTGATTAAGALTALGVKAAGAATATAAGTSGLAVYAPDNAASTVRNQAVTPAGLAAAMATVGGGGFPDSRFDDITPLPSSSSTLIAPADGWYMGRITFNYAYGYLAFACVNTGFHLMTQSPVANLNSCLVLPVSRGDAVVIEYANVSFMAFRFIYAKGQP